MNALSAFAGQEVWHIAGWTMLHYLCSGTLVGIIAILCRVLLRRVAANVRYATALICLFLLAALPFGIASWLMSYPPPLKGGISEPVATIELKSPSRAVHDNGIDLRNQHEPSTIADNPHAEIGVEPVTLPITEPSPNPSLLGRGISFAALHGCVPYLPWLWIIGTPITFALLAAGVVGTKRLRSASHLTDDRRILDLLARLSSSLRISKRISVAVCDRIASPVLVGIVRPMILLPPAALTGWSPDEIEMVLLHELAHVRRWDNLVNLIQRLIESLLFFHPAVWLVSTWVRRERESCCDAFVVRHTERPHAYAELLISLATSPQPLAHPPLAGLAFSRHPLRARIRRILQLEDDPMLISGKSLTLTLVSLVIAATFCLLYLPAIGAAEESATEVTENTEKRNDAGQQSEKSSPKSDAAPLTDNAKPAEDKLIERLPADTITGELVAIIDSLIDSGQAKGMHIVVGLPPNTAVNQFEFAKAMRERHKAGKIAEASTAWISGDQVELIVERPHAAIPPSDEHTTKSDDNWPKGISFPSPKDGEISARAWERFQLKFVVATGGLVGRVQIWGAPFSSSSGSNEPVILTAIDGIPVDNFDNLGLVLRKLDAENRQPVKFACTTYAEKGPIQLTFTVEKPGKFTDITRLYASASAGQHRKFPTLEEQKLADFVWKRLRLEMESISEEDLLRVKTLGYDGGLKVSAGVAGLGHSGAGGENIQTGDILVGLHVWPTITIKDVVAVLNRDDLAELNPLKFYVVRQSGGFSDPGEPVVNTGRISVSQPAQSPVQGTTYSPISRKPPGAASTPTPQYSPPQSNNPYQAKSTEQTATGSSPPAVQSIRDVPSHEPPPPEKEDAAPPKPRAAASRTKITPPGRKSPLRYDGKTFDDWRTEWQTELSTKKRLEAVNALAAFGRAGYGKEAADAILDVAGEYDFKTIDNTGEGSIKNAVLNHLAPYGQTQSMASHWVPNLAARLAKEPQKWQSLAVHLLRRLQTEDKDTIAILRSLAETAPDGVRRAALGALVRSNRLQSGGPRIDDTTQALLTASLKSKDPAVIREALDSLYYQPVPGETPRLVFQPELIPLLFHSDKTVHQAARNWLAHIQDDDAPQAVESLRAILQDDSRKRDRLAAIRALGTIGPKAAVAQPQLEKLFDDESQDMRLGVAAMFAVDSIEGSTRLKNKLLEGINNNQDEKTKIKLQQLFNAEQQSASE